jgi:cytochrome c-type biogenesis protein CcsB
MHATLLWLALAVYGLGIFLTLPAVIQRRPSLPPAALGALGLGLIVHAAAFAVPAAHIGRLPVTDVRSALSFFAFLVTVAFFFAYLRYRVAALGLFMFPMVFLLTLTSALRPESSFSSPAFRSGWLFLHIATIFLGYTGLFVTFVAACMYVIQERALKSKRFKAFYYRLPSLEVCDEIYYRSLLFGLPFLSVGILTGFVWASRTWTGPWELDPKILASLVIWLIYLTLFSTRLAGSWRGRRSAYVAIFGFAAVMATFLGVSLLSGQHGYIPNGGNLP